MYGCMKFKVFGEIHTDIKQPTGIHSISYIHTSIYQLILAHNGLVYGSQFLDIAYMYHALDTTLGHG